MNRILFVCTGNICRSPAAEAVCRNKLKEVGILEKYEIDSAAIHAYHVGESPDYRTVNEGERRGLNLAQIHARQITLDDFYQYDLILGMTEEHLSFLKSKQPADSAAKVDILPNYVESENYKEIIDPYYGGEGHFSEMYDSLEEIMDKLVLKIT